jgi:hypothetical protein
MWPLDSLHFLLLVATFESMSYMGKLCMLFCGCDPLVDTFMVLVHLSIQNYSELSGNLHQFNDNCGPNFVT